MEIPRIGFGTYRVKGTDAFTSTRAALEREYPHIDTANLYKNELEVGQALTYTDRKKVWITTKIKVKDIRSGKEAMVKSILNSLSQLKTDYLDLVLLHGPCDNIVQSWTIMEEIVSNQIDELKGRVRFIGVSNYDIDHLTEILKTCKVKPYANQFEVSPYLNRDNLINYCKANGIIPVAHSSLVKGEKFEDTKLIALSEQTNISKPLLLLAWALAKGLVVLPRSSNIEHITENMKCIDIKLENEIIELMDKFNEGYCTHPQYRPKIHII